MNLENQVCSLELSKRLKEIGVKQESAFYWIEDYELYSSKPELLYAPTSDFSNGNGELDWPRNNEENCHSAFTVSEIAEMLPVQLSKEDILFISKGPDFYNAYYNHNLHGLSWYGVICKKETLADCLADLLLWILEKEIQELTNET